MKIERVIISGGGTGGHIFPAIAIADEIKKRNPETQILFVGATGKMEMEKIPAAGYQIEGLAIAGFQRKISFANLMLPLKIIKSLIKARSIIKRFNPQVVIGVGGYASGPTLQMANLLRIPTVIQEQNSFPGKTNKILAQKARVICTAYEGLETFFPKHKIKLTGNPVRHDVININGKREEGFQFYGLNPNKKTILVVGGSLGARTLNQSMLQHYETIQQAGIQVLWQTGKLYFEQLKQQVENNIDKTIKIVQFIDRMDLAYAVADVIISRAGAISVSELCLIGKPIILVPSPNVAEDHQTKNAMALVNKNAAMMVKDTDAVKNLIPEAIELLTNQTKQDSLSEEIKKLGKPNATADIVNEIEIIVNE
jgi:UDP-N-acetylglucosamine--N-acetylmuramyl-(pentapeptide) pyrophosphoryl-undecaprenol N-acetylglucosamine transferase